MSHDALDALFRPWSLEPPAFASGDRVLGLGIRPHPGLDLLGPATLHAVQPLQPHASALLAAGYPSVPTVDGLDPEDGYAAALVLPDRQTALARASLAEAVARVRPGGTVVIAAPKNLGGNRRLSELQTLVGDVVRASKHHCRIGLGAVPADPADEVAAWRALDTPQQVLDGLWSRPGLFSWDRPDPGSALLVEHLPDDLGPTVLDLGVGPGWLSRRLLDGQPRLRTLHALDADGRAVALARRNLEDVREDVAVHLHWADATGPLPVHGVDAVVTNPPFHTDGATHTAVGQAFLRGAHAALRPGGVLWAVANTQLPYERTLRETFGAFDELVVRGRYKILRAKKR